MHELCDKTMIIEMIKLIWICGHVSIMWYENIIKIIKLIWIYGNILGWYVHYSLIWILNIDNYVVT